MAQNYKPYSIYSRYLGSGVFLCLRYMSRDAGAQFLADTLTQFQLGGADSTHSLLLAQPKISDIPDLTQIS